MRRNRRQAGVIEVRWCGVLRHPSCSSPQACVLYLCQSLLSFSPSLSITLVHQHPAAYWLKRIFLMPLSTSNPLPASFTLSSSVLSFISPPVPCEGAWLPSISLSLESVNWVPVCTRHAQTKCFFTSSHSPFGFVMNIAFKQNRWQAVKPLWALTEWKKRRGGGLFSFHLKLLCSLVKFWLTSKTPW